MTDVDCEKLLKRAASIIEASGWKQGAMFDNGACCALGAVWLALVEQCPDLPKPSGRSIQDCRNMTLPIERLQFLKLPKVVSLTNNRHISSWNDTDCKSQAEMVAKLRELAKVLA